MKSVLEPLLQSPQLPEYVDSLNLVLASERQRRERFYDELTEDGKCEFINGRVVMHSPAKRKQINVTQNLSRLLSLFVEERELGEVYAEKALCVFPRNDYEPDSCFFSKKKVLLLTDETLKFPVPDFVVEVLSQSTEESDPTLKFEDYAAHGVGESWMIDPGKETVEKHLLKGGRYGRARLVSSGDIASEIAEGFRIPVRAIFEAKANRAALRRLPA
jgi:Uma2 family endonuclease